MANFGRCGNLLNNRKDMHEEEKEEVACGVDG